MDAGTIFNTPCMGYGLDDLLAIPSHVSHSAGEVDLSTLFSRNIVISNPVVAAPLDTVTEARMAITLALMGGIGVIHSQCDPDFQAREVGVVKRYESGFIMDPHVLSPHHTVEDVERIRAEFDDATVLVTEGGQVGNKLLGIVTSRDIDFVEDRTTRLANVMTMKAKLDVGTEPISLSEATQKLRISKRGKLPIVNEVGELVALVSRSDLKKSRDFPLASTDANRQLLVAAAVAPRVQEADRVRKLVEAGVDALVFDASKGDTVHQIDFLKRVKNEFPSLDIVCGNVVAPRQAKPLLDAGADGLRVGMGSNSLLLEREVGAVGRPMGSAIYHVAHYAREQYQGCPIIADGGITSSSQASLALTLGASSFMCGTLLAGTTESPGDAFYQDGVRLKLFRGAVGLDVVSSRSEALASSAAGLEINRLPTGATGVVVDRGSVSPFLTNLLDSVKRDLRRLGVAKLSDVHEQLDKSQVRFHVRTAGAFPLA